MRAWDDLRFALAIARTGNLKAASQSLGVDHSTAFRRLKSLEASLGSKLFERLAAGYRPTESGQRMIAAAERMESEMIALDRELTGRDTRLSGKLRVTASETLAYRALTAEIARFRTAHPGIAVDLILDNSALDLSRREADVALRADRPREAELFGRKLADISWALYAAPRYMRTYRKPARAIDLSRHSFIGWNESSPATQASKWIAEHAAISSIGYRSSSLLNQMMAAKAGLGLALLPCYLVDGEKGLSRVMPPLKTVVTELWLITHESLKDTARIRAFMDVVGAGLRRALRGAA